MLLREERWIVLMLSPIVRDVQNNAVANVVAEMGRDLGLDYGTTERSFKAVERRGSTLT